MIAFHFWPIQLITITQKTIINYDCDYPMSDANVHSLIVEQVDTIWSKFLHIIYNRGIKHMGHVACKSFLRSQWCFSGIFK